MIFVLLKNWHWYGFHQISSQSPSNSLSQCTQTIACCFLLINIFPFLIQFAENSFRWESLRRAAMKRMSYSTSTSVNPSLRQVYICFPFACKHYISYIYTYLYIYAYIHTSIVCMYAHASNARLACLLEKLAYIIHTYSIYIYVQYICKTYTYMYNNK